MADYSSMDITPGDLKILKSTGNPPVITMMAGAGLGATATIDGTNVTGIMSITTGTNLSTAADLFMMTLGDNMSFPKRMVCELVPMDDPTTSLLSNLFLSAGNTVSATFKAKGLVLSINTTYKFAYQISGY